MIFEELVIHNFGVYAGRQVIELAPPSPNKPVVLIGGLNGEGKTTLLDALLLCIFGPLAKCSARASMGYREFLSSSINRNALPREAALELAFQHKRNGVVEHFRLHRSWVANGTGLREHFNVVRNGKSDRVLAENWLTQVEEYLPANIAHLFLFNGEQVQSYADADTSAGLVRTAIHSLLGLDVVEQLQKDLQTLARRNQLERKDDAGRVEIENLEQDVEALKKQLEILQLDRASIRTKGIDRNEKRLREVEEEYRKAGGDLYERREQIEANLAEATRRNGKATAELREIASGTLPLGLLLPLLKSVQQRDVVEQETRQAMAVSSVLQERDTALMTLIESQSRSTRLREAVREFMEQDRASRQGAGKHPIFLGMTSEERAQLEQLLSGELAETASKTALRLDQHTALMDEVESAKLEIASLPSPDTLTEVMEERERLRNNVQDAHRELEALDSEIRQVRSSVERVEKRLTARFEQRAEVELENEDRERVVRHVSKTRETLALFRDAVVKRNVERIGQFVLECFQQLLHKTSLVTGLEIDPESFKVTLFGRDSECLEPTQLSAGERQLLAVALLWGQAKASGRALPMAVDTPLGRLDSIHREHLVERYFPVASHQVLLLSTDEEIVGETLERLKPWIGRYYRLYHDDSTGTTTVVPGYFNESQANHVN